MLQNLGRMAQLKRASNLDVAQAVISFKIYVNQEILS
jgi:hypothetical protein